MKCTDDAHFVMFPSKLHSILIMNMSEHQSVKCVLITVASPFIIWTIIQYFVSPTYLKPALKHASDWSMFWILNDAPSVVHLLTQTSKLDWDLNYTMCKDHLNMVTY